MDLFCTIFINTDTSREHLFEWTLKKFSGEGDGRSLKTPVFEMDVINNGDFDQKRLDEFIYYPYLLEIDVIEGVSEEQYISEIGALLGSLWTMCIDAVAACDFEDKLPIKG